MFHIALPGPISYVAHTLSRGRSQMVAQSIRFVAAAVLTLLAAELSYHVCEKQLMRLNRFFVPEPKREISAPASVAVSAGREAV